MLAYKLQIQNIQRTNRSIPDGWMMIIYKLQKSHLKQHLVLYKQM